MDKYILSFKPCVVGFGSHDPSAAIFKNDELLFAVEEERFTRQKHAVGQFPENAINSCLEYANIKLSDVDEIVLPYQPTLAKKNLKYELLPRFSQGNSMIKQLDQWEGRLKTFVIKSTFPTSFVEQELHRRYSGDTPPIKLASHHRCHAISAYHYSPFDEAVVVTIDGSGEYDSTVVWHAHGDNLHRHRTYKLPNSLGRFFGAITEFLGFKRNNGEGKVMGLAPYGSYSPEIATRLKSKINTGVGYDVTEITSRSASERVALLENLFGRERRHGDTSSFTQWEKDLAFTAQRLLEDTVTSIVDHYVAELGSGNVGLAGGVALNCKMNKRILELDDVSQVFIQPVAHDAGIALGGGYIDTNPSEVPEMTHLYYGPEFTNMEIKQILDKNKIRYVELENTSRKIAEQLAAGKLVARFAGRMELGPRALGNRSILADPRSAASRDRVNEFVKHREGWRPFAPSMLEEAAADYLDNSEPAPYMITTFDVEPEKRADLEAVLHPADDTTRPQTVRQEQNPGYYDIISEFENITGVPVVLNTSFNDHGEPIVRTPTEAIKDFYGMGLDILVLNDFIVTKDSIERSAEFQSDVVST